MDIQTISNTNLSLFPLSQHHTVYACFKNAKSWNENAKKWLGLTPSTTVAVIHHPDVIGVPYLLQLQTKATLTFLASAVSSNDPLVQELTKYCLSESNAVRLGIPDKTISLLSQARELISSIFRKTLQQRCKQDLCESQ